MSYQILRMKKPQHLTGKWWHVAIVGKDLDNLGDSLSNINLKLVKAENKRQAKRLLKRQINHLAKLTYQKLGYSVKCSACLMSEV